MATEIINKEEWIVVSFPNDESESKIRMTRRSNFEKMDFCKAYGNYGVQVDCDDAGCYNENHTEVTGWNYHDGHNFRTVVLEADWSDQTDCTELDEEEQLAILLQYPGVPHIEGTNVSVETDDYIFHFDRWATNPWTCYVEKK